MSPLINSLDKAAQAAAQAAQAAALQAQLQAQLQTQLASSQVNLSPEQALQLLQRLGANGMGGVGGSDMPMMAESDFRGSDEKSRAFLGNQVCRGATSVHTLYDTYPASVSARSPVALEATDQLQHIRSQIHTSFSPFSPDPNAYILDDRKRGSVDLVNADSLSQTLNPFPPRFVDGITITDRTPRTSNGGHPFGPYFDGSSRMVETSRSSSRQEPVSRPSSSQTSQGQSTRHDAHKEQDLIHDLNGTLASLDLDSKSPWRPTDNSTARNPSC